MRDQQATFNRSNTIKIDFTKINQAINIFYLELRSFEFSIASGDM